MKITASLVLFHNDPLVYGKAIQSFLDGCDGQLYVVDNSSTPLQHDLFKQARVHYTHTGNNLGFGAGHNKAIFKLPLNSDYHLLLNPDIIFNSDVLPYLSKIMQEDSDIGALMPKIVYPNHELQHLCKLLPSPLDLIFRRFVPFTSARELINKRYELHGLRQDRRVDIPSLSGCFMLLRTNLLHEVGGFDERYFMYMEDVDLVRRIGDLARTVYDPSVYVIHAYAKGSYRNKKLLAYHLKSALTYFNKWGWIFDTTRSVRNATTINLIKGTKT